MCCVKYRMLMCLLRMLFACTQLVCVGLVRCRCNVLCKHIVLFRNSDRRCYSDALLLRRTALLLRRLRALLPASRVSPSSPLLDRLQGDPRAPSPSLC